MSKQPPTIEALALATEFERQDIEERNRLARRIDALCEQRVSAERKSWLREDAKAMRPFEEDAAAILAECERGYEGDEPHKIEVIARALRQRVEAERERLAQEAEAFGDADDLERLAIGIELAAIIRAPAERPAPEGNCPEIPDSSDSLRGGYRLMPCCRDSNRLIYPESCDECVRLDRCLAAAPSSEAEAHSAILATSSEAAPFDNVLAWGQGRRDATEDLLARLLEPDVREAVARVMWQNNNDGTWPTDAGAATAEIYRADADAALTKITEMLTP